MQSLNTAVRTTGTRSTEVAQSTSSKPKAPPNLKTEATEIAKIFEQHLNFVLRVLRRLGVAEADLEDVCQDVFIVIHQRLATYEGRSTIRTWIYGICLRVTSDYRRRAYRRREIIAVELPEPGVEAQQDLRVEMRQAREQLNRLLGELSEDKRNILILFKLEERPMNEVARIVGCPLKTAYSRYYAARDELSTSAQRI